MEAHEMSHQETESLAGDVMESLGEPREAESEINDSHDQTGKENSNDPLYVQKRLKQQKRAHEREIRALHAKIDGMQSSNQPRSNHTDQTMDHYAPPESGNVEEHIHRAVNIALQHRDMEERKVKEAEHLHHVHKRYQELDKHLDSVSDKYDDFDDVVRAEHVTFTPSMRDAALFLPLKGAGSAGEVMYKLGKNHSERERISKLHPVDQAREINMLSHALANGAENRSSPEYRSIGNIKSNPAVNSHAINDKTSPSDIRARMKAGKFK